MAVPVDLYVMDDSASPAPIVGAVVGVYDPTTFASIAQATTSGLDGRAAFLLPGTTSPGTAYEVRAFKLGARFANPFSIQILEPIVGALNQFDISGTLVGELPAATDPRLCRCTARFMNLANSPVANASVRIATKVDINEQAPMIVDGNLISSEVMAVQTDSYGYLSVDLVRGGEIGRASCRERVCQYV